MPEEINRLENQYIVTDKRLAPWLLSASFHNLISYKGHFVKNGVVHWVFAPKDKVLELIDQFSVKTEPHIPAQDIFMAIETFWEKVASYKKLEVRNRNT